MKRKKLKLFRIANDLTQEQMAEKLEITKTQYLRIELGYGDPSFGLMKKFGKAFEGKYDDLWELFYNE